ncbi:MAG: hypothetical protein RI955_1131 [Bacteroidota bacterium]|jgi:hypothetical protein
MKKILLLLCIISICFSANAQFSEVGLLAGESHYIGEMSLGKLKNLKEAHFAGGLFYRHTFARGIVGFRAGLTFAKISGDDRNFAEGSVQAIRNLNFESGVQSVNAMLELNIPGITPCKYKFFSPYLVGGITAFHFNPIANYYGATQNLHSLNTEGQGIEGSSVPTYSLTQIAIPIGGGLKILCRDIFIVQLEVLYHKTFTDYLDDVSGYYFNPTILKQTNGDASAYLSNPTTVKHSYDATGVSNTLRGDATKKDAYVITSIAVSYLLGTNCGRSYRGIDFGSKHGRKCNEF